MEVITIDSIAYQKLEKKINDIAEFVFAMNPIEEDKWLSSDETAELLGISTRTLQRLRSERVINYSMLRGRCRHKSSEIERILNERVVSSNPKTLDEIRESYRNGNGAK